MNEPASNLPRRSPEGVTVSAEISRPIASCLTCRRRKVRCDHGYPICAACLKGNHVCSYLPPAQAQWQASPANSPPASGRIAKPAVVKRQQSGPSQTKINARLERLEELLMQVLPAVELQGNRASSSLIQRPEWGGSEQGDMLAESRNGSKVNPLRPASMTSIVQTPHNGKLERYNSEEDTLLVDSGHAHFVSAQHWALLADEFQDIKELLSATVMQNGKTPPESQQDADSPYRSLVFGHRSAFQDIISAFPDTREDCFLLLGVFFSNVDPMLRLLHKSMVTRKFDQFTKRCVSYKMSGYDTTDCDTDAFDALAMAICFSAVNSMSPTDVIKTFQIPKSDLLERFKRGTELCLEADDFLTSDSIVTLQAFVILLSAQCREDNIGKVWPLTGLAIRIGITQGLHRDPSRLPSYTLDAVQIELRRRLWAQICYLDYRSAEALGHEPTIYEDQFDTLLPSNIDDSDLVEGSSLSYSPASSERFTDMTHHLVRLTGISYLRKLVRHTSRFEKRTKMHAGQISTDFNLVEEQQILFETVRSMAQEMNHILESLYLRHCDARIAMQRYTLEFGVVLECKFWITFWLRLPREYREAVVALDERINIFEKCINLIETLGTVSSNKDTEAFHWHIDSHSAFHAVFYVLSELKSPMFQQDHVAQLKDRGLKAIIKFRNIRGIDGDKLWNIITRLICESNLLSVQPELNTVGPEVPRLQSQSHQPSQMGFQYLSPNINDADNLIGNLNVQVGGVNMELGLWDLDLQLSGELQPWERQFGPGQ